jgi:hypothetical protein
MVVLLRYMPPRGQKTLRNRRVLDFDSKGDPKSVTDTTTPAEEAAQWMQHPEKWPSYVPSFEVWCAMTCSSGDPVKDAKNTKSPYFKLRQKLLTHGLKAQIKNGAPGLLQNYLVGGKPKTPATSANTHKEIADEEKGLKKFKRSGYWPAGEAQFPEGVIGLDTQVKMRDRGAKNRVPHTYKIGSPNPYHLEALSSIMPYTKRQWTLNMGVERMQVAASNTEQNFETTPTGHGGAKAKLAPRKMALPNQEVYRGPAKLGQIALLYGLYEYPGSSGTALNWTVKQTVKSSGSTHTVRMRVPNPDYWLIDSARNKHYRCIEEAHETNLATTTVAANTKANAKIFENYGFLEKYAKNAVLRAQLEKFLPGYKNSVKWWGYNILGDSAQSLDMRSSDFFPGMRVPLVNTLHAHNVPLLPETQIYYRFVGSDGDENRSLLSPFFYIGVRDDKAQNHGFIRTPSPWGLYGYIAWRMKSNAEFLKDCKCLTPFPMVQPVMLTGFKIPKARWLYPHFKVDDGSDTLKVTKGHPAVNLDDAYIHEAAVGRNFTTFLERLKEPMKRQRIFNATDPYIQSLGGDGFCYMGHLKDLFTGYIGVSVKTVGRDTWLAEVENRRRLRVRALTLSPVSIRDNDHSEVDLTVQSTVEEHVKAAEHGHMSDEEEDDTLESIETKAEMDRLNAANENRGSILEALNEMGKQFDPSEIDDALGKKTDEELVTESTPAPLRGSWEDSESNRHFNLTPSAPWSYSDIYEQPRSVPEYETGTADASGYVERYGSDYNLYLDGPHPRLLKGFKVSYGTVKIFAGDGMHGGINSGSGETEAAYSRFHNRDTRSTRSARSRAK